MRPPGPKLYILLKPIVKLNQSFTFLRPMWTSVGTRAGTGGPKLGRSSLPGMLRAEAGLSAAGAGDPRMVVVALL